MADFTDKNADAAGLAALAVCESLLLALVEQKVMKESDVRGVLEDAAATHRGAADMTGEAKAHRAAAKLIEQLIAAR